MNWQPIADVPTDTRVFVYSDLWGVDIVSVTEEGDWYTDDGDFIDDPAYAQSVTHWMPLPEAPE